MLKLLSNTGSISYEDIINIPEIRGDRSLEEFFKVFIIIEGNTLEDFIFFKRMDLLRYSKIGYLLVWKLINIQENMLKQHKTQY